MHSRTRLAASLTAADPLALGEAARTVLDAGADLLHVDFGDGAFVPWLGGSVEVVEALARRFRVPVEVHLMVERPEDYIETLAAAGATGVTIHAEATRYPWRLKAATSRAGMRFGVAANPATAIAVLEPYLAAATHVTLLTTEPDASGELLLPGSLARIRELRRLGAGELEVEVDGGVTVENAPSLIGAGATGLVLGRALARAEDPAAVIAALRAAGLKRLAS